MFNLHLSWIGRLLPTLGLVVGQTVFRTFYAPHHKVFRAYSFSLVRHSATPRFPDSFSNLNALRH